jgi:hypothetical protein
LSIKVVILYSIGVVLSIKVVILYFTGVENYNLLDKTTPVQYKITTLLDKTTAVK